jgi:hypothetical protein
MMKLMSPTELKALHELWPHLPGNFAGMRMGIVNFLAREMAEKAPLLLAGQSTHMKIGILPGPPRDSLVAMCGSEEEAIKVWCGCIFHVLEELAGLGWGVLHEHAEPAWELGFYIFGPCARHGLPVDPVVGGCATCLAELPRPDPAAIRMIQHRPDVVN